MSRKNKKPAKLRARLPRGFVDRDAADIRAANAMLAKIAEVYERYGFDPVETPLFEYTDALGKFLPDADRPNEGVFSLTDDDDQWMSLRYDLTAPLARHVAENYNTIQLPYRTYRVGWVFRNEKPGPGRFRQFMQFDADSVGAPGVQADAEMCMMMADVMEALGIERGDYLIRVNNRKVLDGIMEAAAIAEDKRLDVMRAMDKLDRLGRDGVEDLLGKGREDESGDVTKGVELEDNQVEIIMNYLFAPGETGADKLAAIGEMIAALDGDDQPSQETATLMTLTDAAGYQGRVVFDPSVVRGLEYYTGPVYEAELTFDVVNEKGKKVVFGSVGGGGRYDGLVSRFMGQPVPATGFSIGVSRLMTALKNLGKLEDSEAIAPVVVCIMDRDTDALIRYQGMVQTLREAGIRAEMYQGNPKKFGNQLKYADHRGAPIAIIQGSDERSNGEIQIKDLIEGKRLSAEIEDNVTWRETRPAQITAKEADLVSEVKRILEEQAADRIAAKAAD
ncbi:MAG: histidine--tRNA ligase [Rhizobiaceae bacterium]|nr:histidine--tRNA ligase [Rhizobiaceae bacterium]